MNLASLLNTESAGVELNGQFQVDQQWYQCPPAAEESPRTTHPETSSESSYGMHMHHDHRTTFVQALPDSFSAGGYPFDFPNSIPPVPLPVVHPNPEPTSELRLSPNVSASDEEIVEEDAPPRKRRRQGLSCLGWWSSCIFVVLDWTCDAQSLATRHRTS